MQRVKNVFPYCSRGVIQVPRMHQTAAYIYMLPDVAELLYLIEVVFFRRYTRNEKISEKL